jgi:hypothetical protein
MFFNINSKKKKKKKKEEEEEDNRTNPAALFRARDAVLTISPLARTTWKTNDIRNTAFGS